MKYIIPLLLALFSTSKIAAQYYLRGEVKNEQGVPLEGVRINMYSKGATPFYSAEGGAFGVVSGSAIDTITLFFDGYEVYREAVNTQSYQKLVMKMLHVTKEKTKKRLSSIITNLKPKEQISQFSTQGESYTNLLDNSFIASKKYPETGFALTIDRAAYSNTRRFLNNEIKVPTDAVRIEEMLNYFRFRPLKDPPKQQFTCNTAITSCPWNANNQLFFINLNAPKLNLDTVPPSNLVFLIDVSGSMDKDNRLPLLQSAFKLLTENVRDNDIVSIVTYGGNIAVALPPTSGSEKERIKRVIDSLTANGDTYGEGAIRMAYNLARQSFIKKGNNRVILATDGDFNVGQTSEKDLEDMISYQRETGIYLTCLGVGMGNYKDSKLETLAKKGNGNFAYIDNIQEAEKVLVTELTKTLYTVANDAFLDVKFNADLVKEYRLIGFDNKKDAVADTTSELEGGEVGSGHSMMVVFEIEPAQKLIDTSINIASLQLKFSPVKSKLVTKQLFEVPYKPIAFSDADKNFRFATSVAMFGSLLKQSRYAKGYYGFGDILTIAKKAVNETDLVQQEFLTLIQKADKIYNLKRKKNKDLE